MTQRRHILFDDASLENVERIRASLEAQGLPNGKSAAIRYALNRTARSVSKQDTAS